MLHALKYHQLTLQAKNYMDLWLDSHQQNKQTNKQTNKQKKYSQWWTWGARAKATVLKPPKQSLWSSTDESYHFSHYI